MADDRASLLLNLQERYVQEIISFFSEEDISRGDLYDRYPDVALETVDVRGRVIRTDEKLDIIAEIRGLVEQAVSEDYSIDEQYEKISEIMMQNSSNFAFLPDSFKAEYYVMISEIEGLAENPNISIPHTIVKTGLISNDSEHISGFANDYFSEPSQNILSSIQDNNELMASLEDWGALSKDERMEIAREITSLFREEFNLPDIPIEAMDFEDSEVLARYDFVAKSINLSNSFLEDNDVDVELAMDIIFEENIHAAQFELAESFLEGTIADGDEKILARLYASNTVFYYVDDFAVSGYSRQFFESHAKDVAAIMSNTLSESFGERGSKSQSEEMDKSSNETDNHLAECIARGNPIASCQTEIALGDDNNLISPLAVSDPSLIAERNHSFPS